MYNVATSKLFNVPQQNIEKMTVKRSNTTLMLEKVLYMNTPQKEVVLGMSYKSNMT